MLSQVLAWCLFFKVEWGLVTWFIILSLILSHSSTLVTQVFLGIGEWLISGIALGFGDIIPNLHQFCYSLQYTVWTNGDIIFIEGVLVFWSSLQKDGMVLTCIFLLSKTNIVESILYPHSTSPRWCSADVLRVGGNLLPASPSLRLSLWILDHATGTVWLPIIAPLGNRQQAVWCRHYTDVWKPSCRYCTCTVKVLLLPHACCLHSCISLWSLLIIHDVTVHNICTMDWRASD